MATWPADGTTAWNTAMLAYLAVDHNTDGTHKNTDGDVPTANDSEGNAMLKAHAYLTQTSGFVTAYDVALNDTTLYGYVGITTDPESDGTVVQRDKTEANYSGRNIFFFVPNGKYFEITEAAGTPTIEWTPLSESGAAPIDQD